MGRVLAADNVSGKMLCLNIGNTKIVPCSRQFKRMEQVDEKSSQGHEDTKLSVT